MGYVTMVTVVTTPGLKRVPCVDSGGSGAGGNCASGVHLEG